MASLHIDMHIANSIFTRTQAEPGRELIGVIRAADSASQRFEASEASMQQVELGEDDIPVIHSEHVETYRGGRVLTVRTDTRGVMQLHAYLCGDDGLQRIELDTGSLD